MITRSKNTFVMILLVTSGILYFSTFGVFSASSSSPASPPATHINRIITLAPNLTEIVFALEQGSRVIGVSDFDIYPETVKSLPRLGGYLNPDLEQILILNADAVFLLEGRTRLEQKLEEMGLRCLVFKTESYNDIVRSIRRIGQRLGIPKQADILVNSIEERIVSCRPIKPSQTKIMLVVGTDAGALQKIYVAGHGSFLNHLVEQLGAVNIFGDVKQAFFEVSSESIIDRNPEIIIELLPGRTLSAPDLEQRKNAWNTFRSTKAVQNAQVHIVTDDFLLIPGPRMGHVAEIISRLISSSQDVKQ